MAIVVTDRGNNRSGAGVGATVTLTGNTIAAGSLIFVFVVETSGAPGSSAVTDTAGNTYTALAALTTIGTINGRAYYCANCAALSSGTITYTKASSAHDAGMTALSATNLATSSANDAAVTALANAFGTTASVTSGTPSVAGELFIGVEFCNVDGTTPTQASGWSSSPGTETGGASTINMFGGNLVNAGTTAQTWATPMGSGVSWSNAVYGFKPPGAAGGGPIIRAGSLVRGGGLIKGRIAGR